MVQNPGPAKDLQNEKEQALADRLNLWRKGAERCEDR